MHEYLRNAVEHSFKETLHDMQNDLDMYRGILENESHLSTRAYFLAKSLRLSNDISQVQLLKTEVLGTISKELAPRPVSEQSSATESNPTKKPLRYCSYCGEEAEPEDRLYQFCYCTECKKGFYARC